MRNLWRKLMKKRDRLVAEPKDEGIAYFSYDGVGLAVNIGRHDIDEVFEAAKNAIKLQMERRDETGQEKGEEVRFEGEVLEGETAEPVDGDTPAGGVSGEVHGPEESDVR